jgi:uncharacterized DUF497 family protein
MPYFTFFWNDHIEAHLADNDVTPEEFEEVVSSPDRIGDSDSSGRPMAFGYTTAGRFLVCVYEMIDEDEIGVLPVTAFEPETE